MTYDVPLIPQSTSMSCWAASMAMVMSWYDQASFDPERIAQNPGGPSYMPSFRNGLDPNDRYILERNGFTLDYPQCYTFEAVKAMLRSFGPIWFASLAPAPHIRVIRGFQGDQLVVNDPGPVNRGSQYNRSFTSLFGQMEALGASELKQRSPVYIAYME